MSPHALEPLPHEQQNNNNTCLHSRLVDDIANAGGPNSGMVKCLECGMIIADPHPQREDS